MRRLLGWLGALFLALVLLAPATAAQATPYCGIRWGSLAKTTAVELSQAPLTNIRTGRHACYDRMVLDIAGDTAGYSVAYVKQVSGIASGAVVPVRGGARLQVTAYVPANDDAGRATYRPGDQRELRNVTGYRTFRQLAWAGSFEGHTSIGLGVRARLPFRVFVLAGPGNGSRLVVDVAHRW